MLERSRNENKDAAGFPDKRSSIEQEATIASISKLTDSMQLLKLKGQSKERDGTTSTQVSSIRQAQTAMVKRDE